VNMSIGSLFSGIIGGLELGLERAGLGPVAWQCEIDPFCRSVLKKHWPEATQYEDVKTLGASSRAARVRVLCGGFPCQDVSLSGKREGLEGARSGLWFEFRRIIEELEPSIVVIENVLGLRTKGLRRVLEDLSDLGFDAEWTCLAASDVGAPHRRKRIFIVATHPDRVVVRGEPGWLSRACWAAASESANDGTGGASADTDVIDRRRSIQARESEATDDGDQWSSSDADRLWEQQPSGRISDQWRRSSDGSWWPPVSAVRRVDDGIPNRSHGRRLKALGNAVVPQCAETVGDAIVENVESREAVAA
jgi:DNA (cytosine-5)-methyltransferase 1